MKNMAPTQTEHLEHNVKQNPNLFRHTILPEG
jgi:hypothetical protein